MQGWHLTETVPLWIGRPEAPMSWTRLATMVVAITAYVGPQWTPQTAGVAARLRGVSAVSDRVAWASGANGTVVRTADGGLTWQRLRVPDAEQLDFRDIDAI